MARLTEELQAEMRDTIFKEAVASFERDWQRTPDQKHGEMLTRHTDIFVATLTRYVESHPYPESDENDTYQSSFLSVGYWFRELADAFYHALPEDERHLNIALTDALGEDALAPRFDGLGAIRRWVFRFGIAPAGISEENLLDESALDPADKEGKWRRILAVTTVKHGAPVSLNEDAFGWMDIGEARDHLKECPVVHVSAMKEDETWSEFNGTFSTSDKYSHGVGLYGCHCECRRWVGDIRWQTEGISDPLRAVLETAGLL